MYETTLRLFTIVFGKGIPWASVALMHKITHYNSENDLSRLSFLLISIIVEEIIRLRRISFYNSIPLMSAASVPLVSLPLAIKKKGLNPI